MTPDPSLLARFAENLYWLGRYVERAENVARVLHVNETYARDSATGPSWQHVLDLYGDTGRFMETHKAPVAQAVLRYYIREQTNPSSIVAAVASARENARSVRHLISTEMWTQINLLYGRVQNLKDADTTITNLSRTATGLITGLQTFAGVAEGTFLQGEPWCFYQLGRYLERADQTTRVLDISYDQLSMTATDVVAAVQWGALLRSVSGYYAYRSRYPTTSRVSDIVGFLLYDTEFPRAVSVCVMRASDRLRDLERRHGQEHTADLEQARRGLEFALSTGPGRELDPEALHAFLDQTQVSLAAVSNAIGQTYFSHAGAGQRTSSSGQTGRLM